MSSGWDTRARRATLAMMLAGVPAVVGAQGDTLANGALQEPVASRRLPRGTVLSATDIRWRPTQRTARSSTPAQQPTTGWVTRRVILEGELLRPPAVVPAPMVRAGDPVRVRVTVQGLQLTTAGIATTSAVLGDTISVRLGPHRRLSGVVTGPNLVTAPVAPSNP